VVQVDRVAGLAGGDRQADGEHGLADPGWAEEADVGLVLDELQRGQVADLAGVQVRLEGEVEGVQTLVVGQPGQLQRVAEAAALAQPELFLQYQVDELQVAHLGLLGAGEQGVEVVSEPGQAEPLGVFADAGGDQLAHDLTPATSS
jgi:hypothetical protein